MDWLAGARIVLTPRPVYRRQAALETAMLGHYPSTGRVRLERLRELTDALEDLRNIGFGAVTDAVLSNKMQDGSALSDRLLNLYHLPIPLRSSAEFHDIFPDSRKEKASYVSLLAGDRVWLPQAVDDFFANGGEKLWIVRIPEEEEQSGFLPRADTQLHDIDTLRGLATVLVIPSLAVVVLPDLERLQIPARLPDVPRVRLENPNPQFLPRTANLNDDHRERRYSAEVDEIRKQPEPWPLEDLLRGILQYIARYRPDIQWLFSLPLKYSSEIDSPIADPEALSTIVEIGKLDRGRRLRHIQFLFPYLRGPRLALHSSVGVIAGKQASVARAKGPWQSIGARPLLSESLPYPRQSLAQILALREDPGVSVLQQRIGFGGKCQLCLDDERLAVPALPPDDYLDPTDRGRYDGFRSAEVMRFLGFLRRQLRMMGEQLVFNTDPNDPRPRLLLEQFFRRLYDQGALRGEVPEQAYHIRQSQPQENAIQFDIEIAPAFPIDRIFLTFINQNGEWQGEVSNA